MLPKLTSKFNCKEECFTEMSDTGRPSDVATSESADAVRKAIK